METYVKAVELSGEDENGEKIVNFLLKGASVYITEEKLINFLKTSEDCYWNL